MKYIFFISLFLVSCKLQIPSDVKHHYAGVAVATTAGAITYKFIERPFVSGLVGFGSAWVAGDIKENWYDGKLGRGVKSIDDKRDTRWGGACGGFYVSVGYTIKQYEQEIDTAYFNNLNKWENTLIR